MDALRIEQYKHLCAILENEYAIATQLEAAAMLKALTYGTLYGIPVYSFSTGTLLFETDRSEAFLYEFMQAYQQQMHLLQSFLSIPSLKLNLLKDPSEFFRLEDFHVLGLTEYGTWLKDHQEEIRRSKEVLQEKNDDSIGTFIQCKRCKSNAVDVEQKQTRSADEPMTLFCMCRNCHARFVMH